ncbi:MAG: glucose-6-phosphate isomerase [Pseudomonadota bacterium]|nr:glucose-6-phosphate isomerase [Pseudomonadota bacterium]
MLEETAVALGQLRAGHNDGSLPFLRVADQADAIATLEPIAEKYVESFDQVVFFGVGGSSLGARTICGLASEPVGHERPRLHFLDNIDPSSFTYLIRSIDPARTGFVVTSKSGSTPETMSQFLVALELIRDGSSRGAVGEHFTAITEPGARPLRTLAEMFSIPVLDHDPGIGGRYAALSVVGLLPALIAGLDAEALIEGAADALQPLLDGAAPGDFAPAVGAAIQVGLAQHAGIRATVLMPYLDRMANLGLWHRQLWAESLGKDGHGTTPINAIGATDQHSQLQLYLDGPADKMFTLLSASAKGQGSTISNALARQAGVDYLAGRRMGDLMDAELRATSAALSEAKRPVRLFTIDNADEADMGSLMMHFMAETVIAAYLLGVNAFDQPAVEKGKVLARHYLEDGN